MSNQEIIKTFNIIEDDVSDLLSECSDISYIFYSQLDLDMDSVNFDLSNGSPIDTNNFKIVHYNVNSILAPDRLEQLSNVCQTLKIDVLVITESKLDNTIPTNIIIIPGYHEPLRHDRQVNGRNGGGVLVYIKECLPFKHQIEFQYEQFEHIWVDIKIQNKIFAVNALYRPPNQTAADHDMFLSTTQNILEKLRSYTNASHKIITSDLNFGNIYCKNPILIPKPLDTSAPDLFSSFGFKQLINIPTRVTDISRSLVDQQDDRQSYTVIC